MLRHPVASARILRRRGATLAGAVELAGLWWPERAALVRDGQAISCGALAEAVRRAAARLRREHPAGTRIGVFSDGGVHTIVLLAAAIGAGLDAVVLGPRLGERDLERVIEREGLVHVLRADDPASHAEEPDRDDLDGGRAPGALILLTTGSTGLPKAQKRGSLSARAVRSLRDLDRRIRWPRGPVLVLAPIDHGHGLSAVLSALLGGRTALLAASRTPEQLTADVARFPPVSVTGVPLQLAAAIDSGLLDSVPLRRIVSGSSRLEDTLAARLVVRTGATLIDCLGTTETGTFAVREPPGAFRGISGMRLRVDEEGGLRVESAFAAGRVATGDTARRVPGGIVVTGRVDGLVDSGGELVAPERMREAIASLPGVRACEVQVVDDELRGGAVLARVEVEEPGLARPGVIRELLIPMLGRASVPRRIEVSLVSRVDRTG